MKYLNIDAIVPDEQVIEIGGRRFDISRVPARKTTELIRVGAWANSPEVVADASKKYDVYVQEMQALLDVLGEDQNGEPATFDWVMDNVTNAQFVAILGFVTDCISGKTNDTVASGETPANFTGKPTVIKGTKAKK